MADEEAVIADALGVTRNLHRLIITASLVTLVFSLSLRFPDKIRSYQQAIGQFLRTDFSQYDRFVESEADKTRRSLLKPIAEQIRRNLDASNSPVFGLGDIADAFEKPIFLGRFKVSDTKLNTPSDLTLKQLESLAELYPLASDVRVVVAETTNLLDQIRGFLTSNAKVGMRVQTITLDTSDTFSLNEAPADGENIKMVLSFGLMPNGGPPAPYFQGVFDAKVRRVPKTSFQSWLLLQPKFTEIGELKSNDLKWLPVLDDLPRELTERRFGDVFGSLSDELQKGSPESKSVSLLGAEIPGLLLVYAAPLILLGLCYYLLFHLIHLSRFAREHKDHFEKFAWLPLSLRKGWIWETLISIGVLPLASQGALAAQLWRFHFLKWPTALFIVIAATLIGFLCWRSVIQVKELRRQIRSSSKDAHD